MGPRPAPRRGIDLVDAWKTGDLVQVFAEDLLEPPDLRIEIPFEADDRDRPPPDVFALAEPGVVGDRRVEVLR
jgi:hypothetical protein